MPAVVDEDVRGFEVAMNDPFGMRGFERFSNLRGEPQRFSRWKTLRLLTAHDRRPVHILHDQIVRPYVINLAYVGMIEGRNRFGFTLEAFAELRGGYLDRHVAIQAGVPGSIHCSHATRTDGR
jgi:hypothetical protein